MKLEDIEALFNQSSRRATINIVIIGNDIGPNNHTSSKEGLIFEIFKMKQNGVSGRFLKLFRNYLNNRKQRVVINSFPC